MERVVPERANVKKQPKNKHRMDGIRVLRRHNQLPFHTSVTLEIKTPAGIASAHSLTHTHPIEGNRITLFATKTTI